MVSPWNGESVRVGGGVKMKGSALDPRVLLVEPEADPVTITPAFPHPQAHTVSQFARVGCHCSIFSACASMQRVRTPAGGT